MKADSVVAAAGNHAWVPLVHGAKGTRWIDRGDIIIRWIGDGLEVKLKAECQYGSMSRQIRNTDVYFRRGVAFAAIGNNFTVRLHREPAVFSNAGLSLYPEDLAATLCALSTTTSARMVNDLAPGIRFDVGDINRLPLLDILQANTIVARVSREFGHTERATQTSHAFRQPGPSPWRHAQEWAQLAVDRAPNMPLPPYEPEYDPEPPTDHLSYALGVALGRFGLDADGVGTGILDPDIAEPSQALPAGILFLDGTLDPADNSDSLGDPAAQLLHNTWTTHGPFIDTKRRHLRDYLRLEFFGTIHRKMYENRPIHWPLTSSGKTFVAWVTIHRWGEGTLRTLLAEHLQPALKRLDGELADLREARQGADTKSANTAERRFAGVQKAHGELVQFIQDVRQCAEKGALPTKKGGPEREVDARYHPDLDDGVMINSAALWPLLNPVWKDPKKWWTELCAAKGRKDYDWSHLAMKYWPTRVDEKCQKDPSLGVAHGCFWKYHPARAWAWELRLQDEIEPDFRIEEESYRGDGGDVAHRAAYLADHGEDALKAIDTEVRRRAGRGKDRVKVRELSLLESGLWTDFRKECEALERTITKWQSAKFRLLAPDSPHDKSAPKPGGADKVLQPTLPYVSTPDANK